MKRILIDDEKCMACNSCELACCVANSASGSLYGALAEQPPPVNRVHVEVGGKGRGFPLGCRHCQDAQCVRACVTKALYRTPEGIVLVDEKRCIGCLMCFVACPFGSIEEGRKGAGAYRIYKCDLCTTAGQQPACVSACPTKALVFEDPDGFSKNKRVKYLVELAAVPESIVA